MGRTPTQDFMALFRPQYSSGRTRPRGMVRSRVINPRSGRAKAEWKIVENPQWTTITSIRGKPVLIFANKPLLGDDDPDAKAQKALAGYLDAHHLRPTDRDPSRS